MKSIVFSVACALSIATPGFCGDLGRADLESRNDLPTSYSYSANCYGSLDKPQGPECVIDFVDGKMSVDNSSGITPTQLVAVSENWYPYGYYVSLQYITSRGDTSIAQFSFLKKSVAKQFINTIVLFKSGNLVPDSSSDDNAKIEIETYESDDLPVSDSIERSTCTGPSILCF